MSIDHPPEPMRPDDIASLVKGAIIQRALVPGQPLNQDDLARRFGVSRISLREALRTLVGEGVVVMRPGVGALVTELSAEEVGELYDLRLALEPPLASAVVAQSRRQDVRELAHLLERLAQLADGEPESWSNLDYAFLRRMYELSGRRHTVRMVIQALNLVEPYSRMHVHLLGGKDRVLAEQRAMVEALQAGNAEALQNAIAGSITAARTHLVTAMKASDSPGDTMARLLNAGQSSPLEASPT
jgi:DNA-binding GntR family transcriptional regulator